MEMTSHTQNSAASLLAGILTGNQSVTPNMAVLIVSSASDHDPIELTAVSWKTIYDLINEDETLDLVVAPVQAVANPAVDTDEGTAEISYLSMFTFDADTPTVFGRVSLSMCYVLGSGVARSGATRSTDTYYVLSAFDSSYFFVAAGDALAMRMINVLSIGGN